MKRIALLGGMSWESTIEHYRLVNELVARQLGGLHSADCLLRSVDFTEVEVLQREDRWSEAGERLAHEAQALEAAGAELLVLCTNTMHKVAAEIELAITIPFIHNGDTTATAMKAAGHTRVGLLATGYTMEQDFYTGRMREHGLDVIVPGPEDRRIVHDELCRGIVEDVSREQYSRIMRALADEARRRSCSAAPRSPCSSAPTTRPSRSSTPPGCTQSAWSLCRWLDAYDEATRALSGAPAGSPRPSMSPSPARPSRARARARRRR